MLEIIEIVAMLETMQEIMLETTIVLTMQEILKTLEATKTQIQAITTLVKLLKKNEKNSFFFISWKKVLVTFL